jgi:hypothetical protein
MNIVVMSPIHQPGRGRASGMNPEIPILGDCRTQREPLPEESSGPASRSLRRIQPRRSSSSGLVTAFGDWGHVVMSSWSQPRAVEEVE